MRERTRRQLCQLLFVAGCVVPTLGMCGWAAYRVSPVYAAAERKEWEQQLFDALGLLVRIGRVEHPPGGSTLLSEVQLIDPDGLKPIGRLRQAEFKRLAAGTVIVLSQPEISQGKLLRLWDVLHYRVLRGLPPSLPVQVTAAEMTLEVGGRAQTFAELSCSVEPREFGVAAVLEFRLVGMEKFAGLQIVRNRQERPALEESMTKALRALSLDEVLRMKNQGAQLLDVREGMEFEGAHLAGSLNIGLAGKYATWCGTMLDREAPIVVIAEPGGVDEAVMRLGRIGFDNVAGYLSGGMAALENYPELVETTDRVTAQALERLRGEAEPPLVLDVRSEKEWTAGHLPGSVNIPLNHLRERIGEVPADRQIAVHCEGGYRSAIAASVLAQEGRKNVLDLVGGYKAWVASQLPTEAAATVGAGA